MDSVSLQFLTPHLWRWVLLLLPAACLAFWAYYGLLAPLSKPARGLLWGLRGLAFLVVLFALWQPVATVRSAASGKPTLAVLLDRSGSMDLPSSAFPGESRDREITEAVTRVEELSDRFDLRWYGFRDGLEAVEPANTSPPAGGTSLGGAIEAALVRGGADPVSGVVLVSDGVHTVGRDPLRVARSSPVPIFTVAIGPESPPTDLEIRKVQTNPRAFVGEPLPLDVVLSSSGLEGREVKLEVMAGEEILESKTLTIEGGHGLEQAFELSVRPEKPGLTLYRIRATVAGDSISQNNERQVAVQVSDRKTQVLCVADAVDWDYGFLRQTLVADTTLAYDFVARLSQDGFRPLGGSKLRGLPTSMADLEDYAAVVMVSTVADAYPGQFLDLLGAFVRAGGGLVIVGGPRSPESWRARSAFAGVLPGELSAGPTRDPLGVEVSAAGLQHPLTQLRDNPGEAGRLFSALPPIWPGEGTIRPTSGARTLLSFSAQGAAVQPAVIVGFSERGKVAWLHGRGWWRWRLTAAGSENTSGVFSEFTSGLMRWIAEPTARERFQVNPGKRVYAAGETVRFDASLWDAGYAPIEGAEISVQVRAQSDSTAAAPSAVKLSGTGDAGSYDGAAPALGPGAYEYDAVAAGAQGELGRTTGRFWVESMGPEFARTWSDRDALRQISAESQGSGADLVGLGELLRRIPESVRKLESVHEVDLWNHWLLFVIFVLVLSTEWFLRRRRGLV